MRGSENPTIFVMKRYKRDLSCVRARAKHALGSDKSSFESAFVSSLSISTCDLSAALKNTTRFSTFVGV